MSSSGSVSSGVDLDGLKEWATTAIANVEGLLGEAEETIAERDRKIRELENNNSMLQENCKDLDEQLRESNLKITTMEQTIKDQTDQLVRMDEALGKIPAFEKQLVTSDEKIHELERTVEALTEEKEVHVKKIATLNDLWKGAVSQTIHDRTEFGEKTRVSEEAMRELMGTVVKIENDLIQNRNSVREMSQLLEQERANGMQRSKEYDMEVGKIQEENDRMKNVIKTLENDKESLSQESQLEVIGLQQEVMNKDAEIEDLKEQLRCSDMKFTAENVLRQLEREKKDAEISEIQAAKENELAEKEEIILNLSSKVSHLETKIQNLNKDHGEKMGTLQEELKNQKALLEETRVLEAQKVLTEQKKNEEAEREKSVMKQTIKDLSNALESIRKDQKWIPMMEEQLENADKELESEKSARKLESEAKTAEIAKLNEAHLTELSRLQGQYAQEQGLRSQLNSKYIEMEMARNKSEEEKATLIRDLDKTKTQLIAKENELKIIMEHEEKEVKEASARYESLVPIRRLTRPTSARSSTFIED
ncbi:hypothetical protein B9Z55_007295 [Caenorhabditis nigoni]|uniref:Uncharacterized protein n=1 Tax=Caenorhabditis nigoni TaxID=1611254 RepID=A0A2G5V926_9PELO|nr:hypothetical protein B9Z55_007295 [Caenorhabditis nigoni]